jgi:4-amino-4-deoxy-L-arabinose transferase-like glycosyltransferase
MNAKRTRQLVICVAVALIVRRACLIAFPTPGLTDDATQYDAIARNLAAGHGFSESAAPPYVPTMHREPLYPVFISIFYRLGLSPSAVYVTQALLGTGVVLVIYLLAREAFVDDWVTLLAALLVACYPVLAARSGYLLTESLFTFLITLGVYLFYLGKRGNFWLAYLGAGLIFGLATLCRSIALLLVPFLGGLLLIERALRRPFPRWGIEWGKAMLLLLVALLVIAPWILRNQVVMGRATLTLRLGELLWARAVNLPDGALTHGEALQVANRETARLVLDEGMTTVKADQVLLRDARRRIMRYPLQYLGQNLKAIRVLWITSNSALFGISGTLSDYLAQGDYVMVATKALLIAAHLGLLVLMLVRIVFERRTWFQWWPLLAPVAYITLVHSFLFCLPRFVEPVLPLVLMFSSVGAVGLVHRVRQGCCPSLRIDCKQRAEAFKR